MARVSLHQIVRYCDRLLKPERVRDYEGAWNGLQVENRGQVRRLAAAVDASLTTIEKAIETRADLLLVHHGLFWSDRRPWTGSTYRLLRMLLDHDLAVYSMHLPLDLHPRLGNNVILARRLGLTRLQPFFLERETWLGVKAQTTLSRAELNRRLAQLVRQPVTLLPFGPARCRWVGVVTGGAGSQLAQAAREGVDTFVTGEGPHWTFALAQELGVNVLYGGHYATETFGVQALAKAVARKFKLPWEFLDHPSGL